MKEANECCGTCEHHSPDGTFPDDWICVNQESEHFADYTEYDDHCDDWEARHEKK